MKTNKLLSAVSAVAIIGASSFALAQGTGGGAGGSAGGGAAGSSSGAGMSSGSGTGSSGASGANSGSGATAPSSPSGGSGAMQNNNAPTGSGATKSERGSPQAQGTGGGMSGDKGSPSRADSKSRDSQKSNQAQDQKSPAGNSKSQASEGSTKSNSTVGAAPSSGGGTLTTEQRTVVREKVLTSSAPRVTNVNFSINVGTVVPSSVRVVAVPQTIIDIRPEWRGYRYFVVNDEIIIVEPNSLKIVAVWAV